MPLMRYQIRNEYSLADQDLYRIADKDDPEALLEGVAMAGLVGVLRQLGDLAQFAAEIFHNLHEEVITTAARGHGLIVRVQQLEAEFPSVERILLSQTKHTAFLYNTVESFDWHPNLRVDQNLVTQGDLPRFVMDSYEECRGPPQLFVLDKFDVAGAGACLKRYTDPSFFKIQPIPSNFRNSEGQREKKTRRVKKRGPRCRNGDTPESFPSSHAKLHELFLEERVEDVRNYPKNRVKLKRQFAGPLVDQDYKKSYMEKVLATCSPEPKFVHDICVDALPLTWISDSACESSLEIVEIGTVSPIKESVETDECSFLSPNTKNMIIEGSIDDFNEGNINEVLGSEAVKVPRLEHGSDAGKISPTISKVVGCKEFADREIKFEGNIDDEYNSDDNNEINKYMDAFDIIEAKLETDSECKKDPHFLNLKPVVVDYDDNDFFKDIEGSSSCPNSVNTVAEITPDLDTAAMYVPSISVSCSDPDNLSVDCHLTYEKTSGTENDEHEGASTVVAVVLDFPKSGQPFVEASNLSCLRENSLLSPELDDVCSSEPDIVTGVNDRGHANLGISWSRNGTIPEKIESWHWSSGEQSVKDELGSSSSICADAFPDLPNTFIATVERQINDVSMAGVDDTFHIRTPLDNPPVSDRKLEEIVKPIDVASKVDFRVPSTEVIPCSREDANVEEVGSEIETLPTISKRLQTHAPETSCSEITEAAETAAFDSIEMGVAGVASSWDESNSEIVSREITEDFLVMGKPPSVLDPSQTREQWQKLPSERLDAALIEYHGGEVGEQYPRNDSEFVSAADNKSKEHIETSADGSQQVIIQRDHHENVIPRSLSVECCPEKLQEQPLLVTEECRQNEDELAVGHFVDLSSHKHLGPVRDDPVDSSNIMCNISSDSSPHHTHLVEGKEDHVDLSSQNLSTPIIPLQRGSDLQDGEPKVKHRLAMNESTSVFPGEPSVSQLQPQSTEHTPESSRLAMMESTSVFPGNGMLSGYDRATQKVENSGQLVYPPGFAALGMLPAEPPINLEPPPLPPLPPMQWRLGRFRHSSAAPEWQTAQQPLGPVKPMTLTSGSETETVAQTSKNEKERAFSDSCVARPGDFDPPKPAKVSEGSSQNNTSGVETQDDLLLIASTSTKPHILTQTSERSSNPSLDPLILAVEVQVNHTDIDVQNEQCEHIPQVAVQGAVNFSIESLPPSTVLYDRQPPSSFLAHDAGTVWSSPCDGIPTSGDGTANGTVQNKPPRPRNPLIDEVVAIDKSKLRKVERVKAPVEPTEGEGEGEGEGESLLEQLQLRKAGERAEQPAEPKVEERDLFLEQLQLRKVRERVKQENQLKTEETISPRVQLRRVGQRTHLPVGSETEERGSLMEQIRKKSFSLKPAVAAKPNIHGPRTNLKVAAILEKASNIRQAIAGSDEDDDTDSWSDC